MTMYIRYMWCVLHIRIYTTPDTVRRTLYNVRPYLIVLQGIEHQLPIFKRFKTALCGL